MEEKTQHRFYENEVPKLDQVVVIRATKVTELGVYVELPEYVGLNGMIQCSELSQRRVRSVKQAIRLNAIETAIVSKIDPVLRTVDLSRRRLRPQDVTATIEYFEHARIVESCLRVLALKAVVARNHLGDISQIKDFTEVCALQNELHTELVWPLYEKYGHAYTAFVNIALGDLECPNTTSFTSEQIREEICIRVKPEPVRITADVQVMCIGPGSLHDLHAALDAALATGVTIHMLSAPLYRLSTDVLRSAEGITMLENAITALRAAKGAICVVTKQPAIVGRNTDIMQVCAEEPESDEETT